LQIILSVFKQFFFSFQLTAQLRLVHNRSNFLIYLDYFKTHPIYKAQRLWRMHFEITQTPQKTNKDLPTTQLLPATIKL